MDAAGFNLFARLSGQALIGNQGVDAAPGQLEVGNLAPDLVGLDHHDHFPGHFGHHPAQAEQLIESGGSAHQVDAIGANEQLVEIVRA
ncbi:hypothetical protein D3C79_720670 [compost metagenome]